MNDNGMVTEASDLIVGNQFWHVYGHLSRSAKLYEIVSEVMYSKHTNFPYVMVDIHYAPGEMFESFIFLGDIGVGEEHNKNRLFQTEQQALDFWDSPECVAYRELCCRWRDPYDDYGYSEDYED